VVPLADLSTVHGMPIPYCCDLTLPLCRSEIIQWVDAAASKVPKKTKTSPYADFLLEISFVFFFAEQLGPVQQYMYLTEKELHIREICLLSIYNA